MSVFHINILTLFPDMFPGSLGLSLSGKALEDNIWSYTVIDIRDFADDKHRTVDDTPYGGGAGMVMRADTIEKALLSLKDRGQLIYLSPRGRVLKQNIVRQLIKGDSQKPPSAPVTVTLLCGRYEGVDQRVLDAYGFEEISIGDYVLSGGEPAALILMDACIRLLPGVMGNAETIAEESFSKGNQGLLEYPHYTRPAEWTAQNGTSYNVPDVLRSGDHAKIEQWRKNQSLALTKTRRPELIADSIKNKTK